MEGFTGDSPFVQVFDSDQVSQQIIKKIIEGLGYRYLGQSTSIGMGPVIESSHATVILVDISSPDGSGLKLLQILKHNEKTAKIPIIALINSDVAQERNNAFNQGVSDYLIKPLQVNELRNRIPNLVNAFMHTKLLERETRVKQKLFSLISHDLRSPFASMVGVMQLLIAEYGTMSDQDRLDFLQALLDNSLQQMELLNNLTHWSRGQSKRKELSMQQIPLQVITEIVLDGLRKLADAKSISLISSIPESLRAYSDTEFVKTILWHLTHNAIKFSPNNAEIRIVAQNGPEYIDLLVEDHGPGIARLPEILNDNSFISTAGTLGEKGNGIGLDICRGLAQRLQGSLIVPKNDSSGTIIGMRLPHLNT